MGGQTSKDTSDPSIKSGEKEATFGRRFKLEHPSALCCNLTDLKIWPSKDADVENGPNGEVHFESNKNTFYCHCAYTLKL